MKNQILKVEFGNSIAEIPYEENKNDFKKNSSFKTFILKNRYRLQFFISFAIAIIFLFIFYYNLQKTNKQEKLSKELLNNYTLTTLYQDKISSEAEKQNVVVENPFVIGMIRINKLNLNYPILSESTPDLLKVSLCRFAGPMPNETGNLCIAGHNYLDNRFFGKLNKLKKNDVIEIYDLAGNKIDYKIYDINEIVATDLSCTSQDVGENKVVTLLTCNNIDGKRMVVKAKENI